MRTSRSFVLSSRSRPCCRRRLNSVNSLSASFGSTFTRTSFPLPLPGGSLARWPLCLGRGSANLPHQRAHLAPELDDAALHLVHLGARRDVVHLAEGLGDLALGEAVLGGGSGDAPLRLQEPFRAMHLDQR